MAAIENEKIFGLKIRESANDGSDFGTPDADYRFLYLGEDGNLHLKDAAAALTLVGTGQGSAFPASPNTNDRFYRTDLSRVFAWTGARWQSEQYRVVTQTQHIGAGTAYAPLNVSMNGAIQFPVPALQGGSDIYIDGVTATFLINSGGSALSGSHSWVGTFHKRVLANTKTTIATFTINSGNSSEWRTSVQAVGALMNNGTTHYTFGVDWTKTGTPGDLWAFYDVGYRIVAT